MDPLVAVPTLVAEPAVVDRLRIDAEQAHEPVRRRLDRAAAPDRARHARGLDRLEIPRARLEAVGRRGEGPDRADLDRVAGEVRREGLTGVGDHLGVATAPAEVDQRVTGDLGGEPRAATTLDAALAVEEDEVADRDRLLEVTLLLDEARLAGPERERLVLERALAAAVAHRAVERVVDEQELENAVLRVLDALARRRDDHAVGHGRRARDLQAAHALDLDEAHAAHAHGLHALVPAEPRDVRAVVLRDLDEQLAAWRLHLPAVDRQGHDVRPGRDRDRVRVIRRPLAHRYRLHGIGHPPTTPLATGIRVERSPWAASRARISSPNQRSRLTTWLIVDGPSAQIVVCANGALRPGTMLLPKSSKRSRSDGRPSPFAMR